MARWWLVGSVLTAILSLGGGVLAQPATLDKGQVVTVTVHGAALEGNVLGVAADRAVTLYLPPGYEDGSGARYPVVYLLHGLSGSNIVWLPQSVLYGRDVPGVTDRLIASGAIRPMIVVMPDASTPYDACFYLDSPVCGGWDTFLAQELVAFVDEHYRTTATPTGRAIAGHDVGGFGALVLAMEHPDVYGAAYAMSPVNVALDDPSASELYSAEAFAMTEPDRALGLSPSSYMARAQLAMGAVASPAPERPPYFVALPCELVNGQPHWLDTVWQAWTARMPIHMLDRYGPNLLELRALGLDTGTAEKLRETTTGTQALHAALTRAGIPHRFELYEGSFLDDVNGRLASIVLPFLSDALMGSGGEAAGR